MRNLLEKEEAQFCAVYGRRRVGKTYLIRETFNYQFAFQHTGFAKAPLSKQLAGFRDSLQRASSKRFRIPRSWMEAFGMLEEVLSERTEQKKVVFLDELSWMDTPKSNFVSALEHFWNSWATARREKDIVLIVCGSSSSWITKKIFRNRGGKEITEAYMILGGVPYYWSLLNREYSLAQNIDRLCFGTDGKLKGEFNDLYASLFENTEPYLSIVEALGEKKVGMTRTEMEEIIGKTSSGTLTKRLDDLELSGFIRRYACLGKKERSTLYQLIDPFTLFYFSFMKNNKGADEHYWSTKLESPVHNTWAGLAFERVCLWHVPQIKQALGIAGVSSQVYSWTYQPKKEQEEGEEKEEGAQIDLLIDRNDKVINLCEMKYADSDFLMTAKEEERIRHRRSKFVEITKTRKAVHITLVTTYGLKRTAHAGIVQQVVTMEDLFKE